MKKMRTFNFTRKLTIAKSHKNACEK